MAIFLGTLFSGQDLNQVAIQNVDGAIYILLAQMTVSNAFAVVNIFCTELPIFLREHFNGMYRTDVYYLARQLVELPIFVFTPILYCSIYYYLVGMNGEGFERFAIACLVLILVTQVFRLEDTVRPHDMQPRTYAVSEIILDYIAKG